MHAAVVHRVLCVPGRQIQGLAECISVPRVREQHVQWRDRLEIARRLHERMDKEGLPRKGEYYLFLMAQIPYGIDVVFQYHINAMKKSLEKEAEQNRRQQLDATPTGLPARG